MFKITKENDNSNIYIFIRDFSWIWIYLKYYIIINLKILILGQTVKTIYHLPFNF